MNDMELPGMWETADFEGGQTDSVSGRDKLVHQVTEALETYYGFEHRFAVSYEECALVALIATLKYQSKIFSSTCNSIDAAYAIELDDIIKEYEKCLQSLH